jgi:hypothetical protein
MAEVWFDYVDDDVPSIRGKEVDILPRIGETVGLREIEGHPRHFKLDRVVDIRHYWKHDGEQEIHVLYSAGR